jgi:hypothetical protein
MRLLVSTDYALRVPMLLASAPDNERISVNSLAHAWAGCRATTCTRSCRN